MVYYFIEISIDLHPKFSIDLCLINPLVILTNKEKPKLQATKILEDDESSI